MKRSYLLLVMLLALPTVFTLGQPSQEPTHNYSLDTDNDGILDIIEICGEFGPIESFTHVKVVVGTDSNPGETTFEIEGVPSHIGHGGPYTEANTEYIHEFDLPQSGDYGFAIDDSEGDGMGASGYFRVYLNDFLIFSGSGNFGYVQYTEFEAGDLMRTCYTSDPSSDEDHDGIVNYKDEDYCVLNAAGVCIGLDKDSDGFPDYLDLDSDGDAITDLVEAQLTTSFVRPNKSDIDEDGINDLEESELPVIGYDHDLDGLDDGSDLAECYDSPSGIVTDPTLLPDEDGDVMEDGNVNYRDAENNNNVVTGIEDEINSDHSYTVFPNPASSNSTVTVKGLSANSTELVIISIDGRSMNSATVDGSGTLDLSSMKLVPGSYVINAMDGDLLKSTKLII